MSKSNLKLNEITEVSFGDTNDFSGTENLTNLKRLIYGFSNSYVADIEPISKLKKLTKLEILRAKLSDIKPLSSLPNLTEINLSGNLITDLSPLEGLNRLSILYVSNNPITNVTLLKKLTKLTELHISGTHINYNDLDSLKTLLPHCNIIY